jgi:glycosyltransferase involved in cell wall biosynthesis
VQALATGLAIVASEIGGFLDLVDDEKNGYLVDAQDVPAFSNALRGLISDPEALLRFRKASIEKSHEFDIQKIVDQYQSILREVVNEH